MSLSRREFLATSLALVTAGCSLDGSDDTEIVRPESVAGEQVLDHSLRLAVPRASVAPVSVRSFERRTDVVVHVEEVPDDDALLAGLRAGATGRTDAILVGPSVLAALIRGELVEPVASDMVTGVDGIEVPFRDPPCDPGLEHSVPKDYTPVGIATLSGAPLADQTWEAFFALAGQEPGRVEVPDDPDLVIGAALVSLGHDWNSEDEGDLEDAQALLDPLRGYLTVRSSRVQVSGQGTIAAMSRGDRYTQPDPGVSFFVPADGSVVLVRSWCIPIYAPHPVSASAWLANAIDPATAVGELRETGLASPLQATRPLVDPALLDNPAVYPPVDLNDRITQPSGSAESELERRVLWEQLGL
jgi:spermidine/putrescine-binding protein